MSERGTGPLGPTRQARTRRKATPRGGRHGLTRVAAPVDSIEEFEIVQVAAPAASRSSPSRRTRPERAVPAPAISRDAEMAYVRADMRKLFLISGALLALMLAILVLIGR